MALSDLLFGKSPSKAAMPYLQQAGDMAQQQYSPYQSQGQSAYEQLNPTFAQMAQDPTGFMDQLIKSYKPSEGFKFQEDYLTRGMQNTAAAGGFAGTPYDQLEQAMAVQGLLGTDMQNYLQNALGVQQTGLAGQQDFYNKGYDSTKNLADAMGNVYGSQAGLAYKGQEQKNKNQADFLKSLIQMGIAGASGGMGGGGLSGALSSIAGINAPRGA